MDASTKYLYIGNHLVPTSNKNMSLSRSRNCIKEVSSSSSSSSTSWKSIAPEVARGDHLNQPKNILNNESSQSKVTGTTGTLWTQIRIGLPRCLRKDAIPRIATQQWPSRNTVGVFWIQGTKATCTKLVLLVVKTPNVLERQFYYHQNHHCHALYIDAE